ncbi:MAG: mannosyl-3-phosphoglycerate synthase [Candidatus Nitrosocosmicus sp.]
MRLDYPSSYTEKIGAVTIHALQKIYEIDSGMSPKTCDRDDKTNSYNNSPTRAFDYPQLSSILSQMAIVIPVKNEKLSLLEVVLSGIPNECLIIIVSNSERTSGAVDRFSMEVEMVKQYSHFADKKIMIIHQKDGGLGKVFKKLGYNGILDSKGKYVRNGKAEGMIIGILLAKMQAKDYVGFIDSDNYFPGAVNEYVKIFAAGFAMSNTPYSNIRILWRSKPKIVNNQIKFPRFGRISESSNKYLNALVSHITGADTDIIMTANAGEHALSMSLAESLNYASGYSVEPYEFINILEKFGGLLPSLTSSLDVKGIEEAKEIAMQKGIEIFQIESRNPHFHEEKGADHIAEMMEDSLLAINNSKICNGELTKEIKNQLLLLQMKQNSNGNIQNGSSTGQMVSAMVNDSTNNQQQKHQKKKHRVMEPLKLIPIDKFAELIKEHSQSFIKL